MGGFNMRYRLGMVILLSLTLMFTLASCNTAAPEPVPAAPASGQTVSGEEVSDNASEAAAQTEEPDDSVSSDDIDEKEALPEPPEAEPALYTDGFTPAKEYADYCKAGKVSVGTEICVEGYVDSFDEEQHTLLLIADEGKWSVSVGKAGTEYFYDLVREAVGQYVRIFGIFTGYSEETSLPGIAFLPREYQNRPYRLESYDNSYRLTQLDYFFEEPYFDTERTYGRITYMEPSSWDPQLTEDTLFYNVFDKIPAVVLAHYETVRDSGFDEIDDNGILSELASSYAKDGSGILKKESYKLKGNAALRFETTWKDEDLPMPMCMYCYMFIIDDEYYFYGTQEPYLVGESVKRSLERMLDNMKIGEASEESEAEEKKDAKTSKNDKESNKTKDNKEAAKEGSGEGSKTKDSTDTKQKEQKAEVKEETQAQEKKSGVPPKSEIQGKTFTQNLSATFVGKENNETFTDSEALPNIVVTAGDLANYDEASGRVTLHENQNGMIMTMVMTFSYDASGNVVYSGDVAIDDPQFIASGTVNGKRIN
jgi:hypothetical protein